MQHIACLLRELDLCPAWNSAILQSECLGHRGGSDTELFVYSALWAPWPLSAPELLITATGVDLLEEEGCVLVAIKDQGKVLQVRGRVPVQWMQRGQ